MFLYTVFLLQEKLSIRKVELQLSVDVHTFFQNALTTSIKYCTVNVFHCLIHVYTQKDYDASKKGAYCKSPPKKKLKRDMGTEKA